MKNVKPLRVENGVSSKPEDEKENKNFPGYKLYPPGEDIYNKSKEEQDIDPENLLEQKKANERNVEFDEIAKDEINMGSDLDIPGSELDDLQEQSGNEDEENNYYSIGGDNHNNLDEN